MASPKDQLRKSRVAFWLDVVLPVTISALLILFTALFFSYVTPTSIDHQAKFFCNPDGDLELPWEYGRPNATDTDEEIYSYSPFWDPTLFISITLGLGHFTFPEAKIIDTCWDIIAGKGGQLLLSIFIYRILRRSLRFTMEQTPISIAAFTSVSSEKISLTSFWKIANSIFVDPARKDQQKRLRLYGKGRLAAFVFVCAYVLSFGTLTSVMTGYQAQLAGFLNDSNSGGLTPLSSLYVQDLVVFDGSRVDFPDDFATNYYDRNQSLTPFASYFNTCLAIQRYIIDTEFRGDQVQYFECPAGDCSFAVPPSAEITNDVASNFSINGRSFSLAHPLNISLQNATTDAIVGNTLGPFETTPGLFYAIGNFSVTQSWVQQNSYCVSLNEYQWGFSSLLLFTFCIFTILFTITLAVLQWELYCYSRSDRIDQPPSIYHDILELADELRSRLGNDVEEMSVKELERRVKSYQGGLTVQSDKLPLSRKQERELRARRSSRMSEGLLPSDERGTIKTQPILGTDEIPLGNLDAPLLAA